MKRILHTAVGALVTIMSMQRCASKAELPYTYPDNGSMDLRGDFTAQFRRGD